MTTDDLCPLCTPDLLDRPRFQWRRYRNCVKHQEPIDMVREKLQRPSLPEGWIPPYERELAAEATTKTIATPHADTRNILQRFEAAAQFLKERRVNLTDAQEKAFLEKLAELVEIYEAEYPGEIPPLACYDADGLLAIRFPNGFAKRSMDARRARAAWEVGVKQ